MQFLITHGLPRLLADSSGQVSAKANYRHQCFGFPVFLVLPLASINEADEAYDHFKESGEIINCPCFKPLHFRGCHNSAFREVQFANSFKVLGSFQSRMH